MILLNLNHQNHFLLRGGDSFKSYEKQNTNIDQQK